jgi:hypothetical protein
MKRKYGGASGLAVKKQLFRLSCFWKPGLPGFRDLHSTGWGLRPFDRKDLDSFRVKKKSCSGPEIYRKDSISIYMLPKKKQHII